MKTTKSITNLNNMPFASWQIIEFRELYLLLLSLGKTEKQAKEIVFKAINSFYSVER